MASRILAVRDRAIDAFGQPIFVLAIGQGVRSFADEINRADSAFGSHPEDYDLYHIGEYDDATGILIAVTPPKLVAVGKDLKQ